jgi:hypothetical protein
MSFLGLNDLKHKLTICVVLGVRPEWTQLTCIWTNDLQAGYEKERVDAGKKLHLAIKILSAATCSLRLCMLRNYVNRTIAVNTLPSKATLQ